MKKYLYFFSILFVCSLTVNGQDTNKPGPLQKWAKLSVNGQESKAYIAFPDSRHEDVALIIIPDGDGISGWEKSMADRLALDGYAAIIPELEQYKNSMAEIEAAHRYIEKNSEFPDDVPEIYVIGIGSGGSKALSYASQHQDIQGVMYFYAKVPEDIGNITVPVYGFYGGDDKVLGRESQEDIKRMSMLGNNFQYYIYPDANHNFLMLGAMNEAGADNRKARNQAWQQMMKILGLGNH